MRSTSLPRAPRSLVIVEGDAWRDAIDEGGPFVFDSRFDQRHELVLVAGKGSADESRPKLNGHRHEVDSRIGIDGDLLERRSFVRGRRKLTFSQPVNAIVGHEIHLVHATPNRMSKLPETNRCGVPVAGDAKINKLSICKARAG